MERIEALNLVGVIIALAIIAYFPFNVLFTESNSNLQLLAVGIILSVVLGGLNMWKYFSFSKQFDELNRKVDKMIEQKDEELGIDKERREEEKEKRKEDERDRKAGAAF